MTSQTDTCTLRGNEYVESLISKDGGEKRTTKALIRLMLLFVLFGLRLCVPVNTFSVMSGRSHRFLGITGTFWEVFRRSNH